MHLHEQIAEMRSDGIGYTAIGKRLGVTRNVVAGVCHRMKITRRRQWFCVADVLAAAVHVTGQSAARLASGHRGNTCSGRDPIVLARAAFIAACGALDCKWADVSDALGVSRSAVEYYRRHKTADAELVARIVALTKTVGGSAAKRAQLHRSIS